MPENSVTHEMERRLRANLQASPLDFPAISTKLVEHLERLYPPVCYTADRRQNLEQHLMYAGKNALVQELRAALTTQQDNPDAMHLARLEADEEAVELEMLSNASSSLDQP